MSIMSELGETSEFVETLGLGDLHSSPQPVAEISTLQQAALTDLNQYSDIDVVALYTRVVLRKGFDKG